MCLATVSSNEQLREENDLNHGDLNTSSNSAVGGFPSVGSKLKSRFSFRRGPNTYNPNKATEQNDDWKTDDLIEPLLSKKGSRLAAAKMVKGTWFKLKKFNFNNGLLSDRIGSDK